MRIDNDIYLEIWRDLRDYCIVLQDKINEYYKIKYIEKNKIYIIVNDRSIDIYYNKLPVFSYFYPYIKYDYQEKIYSKLNINNMQKEIDYIVSKKVGKEVYDIKLA